MLCGFTKLFVITLDMTNDTIRIAIAERLGYRRFDSPSDTINFFHPDGKSTCRLKDYPNDLNACAEFEKTAEHEYWFTLYKVINSSGRELKTEILHGDQGWINLAQAFPKERCEVFLQLHNLWVN